MEAGDTEAAGVRGQSLLHSLWPAWTTWNPILKKEKDKMISKQEEANYHTGPVNYHRIQNVFHRLTVGMGGLQLMATFFRRLWNLGAGLAGGHLKVSCSEVLWDAARCVLSSHYLREPQPPRLLCHMDWPFKPWAKASLSFLRNCSIWSEQQGNCTGT